jgi:hypothetical protein
MTGDVTESVELFADVTVKMNKHAGDRMNRINCLVIARPNIGNADIKIDFILLFKKRVLKLIIGYRLDNIIKQGFTGHSHGYGNPTSFDSPGTKQTEPFINIYTIAEMNVWQHTQSFLMITNNRKRSESARISSAEQGIKLLSPPAGNNIMFHWNDG